MSEETKPVVRQADTSIKGIPQSDVIKEQIARALPTHLKPDRFIRIALTALTKTPKLADCTQPSFFRCLLDLSSMGLEPDGRSAYLIPYGNECTLILSYTGLIELARRSGEITSIRSELVCEHDDFTWENGKITHKVDWRKPRGEIQAAYAEAILASGETQTATMTKDEIDGIRKRSKSGTSGPWATDYGQMAKKTTLRRLCRLLPLSANIVDHIEKDGDVRAEIDVTPKNTAALNLPSQVEQEMPSEQAK
jgi:recombination protein RecT